MPSSREIKGQNEALNDQRDILDEISNLMEDASKTSEDLSKSLSGVADLFQQIKNDSAEVPKNQEKGNKNAKKFNDLLKQAKTKTKDLAKGLMNAAKSVADTMVNALGEIGGILSSVLSLSIVGTLTAVLGTVISNFDYAFKGVIKEVGIGFDAVGKNVRQTFQDLRRDVVAAGLDFKDLTSATFQLSDNFGFAVSEAQQLSFDIADGAKALGVQSDTMASLVGQFSLIGDMSKEQAHLLSEQVGLLAAQNDVAPQAVLKDIAGSTEEMAMFSKGGVKNFAKTAIEARKLGMSVKDVASTLKGMLNFEDSLNKELQASVMLGKNINLNEARRLTFAGDTAGAFQAIAKELGDVDLGSLDPLTLQSVADAAGMSTENLLKMSKGASEMGGVDMGEEALSAQEVAALKARDTMSKMEQVLADSQNLAIDLADAIGPGLTEALGMFVDFLRDFDMAGLKEKFDKFVKDVKAMSWEEIGEKIGKSLGDGIMIALRAMKPLMAGFFKSLGETEAGSFLKSFGVLIALAGKGPLAMLGKVIKFTILKPLMLLGKGFVFVAKKFGFFQKKLDPATKKYRKLNGQFTKVSGFRKKFDKFVDVLKSMFNFGKKILSPFKKIGQFLFMIIKPFRGLAKFVPYLGQVLIVIDGIVGGMKRAKESTTKLGAVFAFVFGAAEGIIRGLITAFTDVIDWIFGSNISEALDHMLDSIFSSFSNIGTSVLGFFTDIPDSIAGLFGGIGETIGTMISDGISGVGNLGTLVADLFSGTGTLITDGISIGATFFSDLFTAAIDGVATVPTAIVDVFGNLGTNVYNKISGAFGDLGTWFKVLGLEIYNMFPSIDFKQITDDMTKGAKQALKGIKDLFTWPINKLIETFNSVKNALSERVLFSGYTLMTRGALADNKVLGTIPGKDISIPRITTPSLGPDFSKLHTGGKIKSDGLVEAKKGEVYAGAGDAAFKPIADEIRSLKSDISETNQLLMRMLTEGIPVMKA